MIRVHIRPTTIDDLPDLARLWNDGEVMAHVGLPHGLGVDVAHLRQWWQQVQDQPGRQHFTISAEPLGYCGEAHYAVRTEGGPASVDIKLLAHARGHGIATAGLARALDEVLGTEAGGRPGLATRAYVDPQRDNLRAHRLYDRLGFVTRTPPPGHDPATHDYLELDAVVWWDVRGQLSR